MLCVDAAAPGKAALDAALLRPLQAEIAVLNKESCVGVFWDFEKFFDTIDLNVLIQEARAVGFPLSDLVMALHMHTGGRRLQSAKELSTTVLVDRSILAGCIYSVALTRVLLHRGLAHLVTVHPSTRLSAYVDDMGQLTCGAPGAVLVRGGKAAVGLFRMAKRLNLTISKRSAVVASEHDL